MKSCVIDDIQAHAAKIKAGEHETVKPGQPARFTAAAVPGDAIWQGDLCLEIVSVVPDGYTKAVKPAKQLVPGTTQGARHCLDSMGGVVVHYPSGWPQSAEETMAGPCLVLSQERTVLHPTHGSVTVPAGFTVLCGYQREYDAELRRERRNQD
jgi:hypothetical protein